MNEHGGTFGVAVNLSAAASMDVAIPFTVTGTAVSGVNYSGLTTSPLIIPAGHTSASITAILLDDGKYDNTNKTSIAALSTPPTNAYLARFLRRSNHRSPESDPVPISCHSQRPRRRSMKMARLQHQHEFFRLHQAGY